jgi:regulatory protein
LFGGDASGGAARSSRFADAANSADSVDSAEPAASGDRFEQANEAEGADLFARRPEAEGSGLFARRPKAAPEKPDAYRKALGLLVRREHSRRELTQKLRAKGADPAEARAALERLEGQGYQDDARFAEMLVRTRIGGGYGPLHIRAELGTHNIANEVAAQVMADAEPDWPALATDALRRRYGGRPPADRAETFKRAHYLQRRGFDAASIRLATAADLDAD